MIALVYAASQNNVIGNNGTLPWHVPSDLKHFKAVTMGKPIIMGRKTWESLPRKPLPGRLNIVLTRKPEFHAKDIKVAFDTEEALSLTGDAVEVCVIGGAEVFKVFMPLAQKIYLTRILKTVVGDVMIPALDLNVWLEVARSAPVRAEGDDAAFETINYQRR